MDEKSSELDELDHEFIRVLKIDDDLGCIVRTHLHIEHFLDQWLEINCSHYNQLNIEKLTYRIKVELAIALGLPQDFGPVLRVLGKLRNDFAHNLQEELNDKGISKLYDALSTTQKECLKLIKKAVSKHRSKNCENEEINFKDLSPKDRFVWIAVAIRFSLKGELLILKSNLTKGKFEYLCGCGHLNKVYFSSYEIGETLSLLRGKCANCYKEYQMKVCWNYI